MNTFTAQELADFYQKVADGGEIEYVHEGAHKFMTKAGPDLSGYLDHWRIKPTKKVIDLSVLIDGIDCEFSKFGNAWYVAKLIDISRSNDAFSDKGGYTWKYCRPRMNHIHAWQGGECPLPEGFMVMLTLREGTKITHSSKTKLTWEHDCGYVDIIAFEVLGLADGYVMPWEQD
tara:strand:+ start:39 stop:560 length:522 start_codon:yes stop_codon:yes gene_type:complete